MIQIVLRSNQWLTRSNQWVFSVTDRSCNFFFPTVKRYCFTWMFKKLKLETMSLACYEAVQLVIYQSELWPTNPVPQPSWWSVRIYNNIDFTLFFHLPLCFCLSFNPLFLIITRLLLYVVMEKNNGRRGSKVLQSIIGKKKKNTFKV